MNVTSTGVFDRNSYTERIHFRTATLTKGPGLTAVINKRCVFSTFFNWFALKTRAVSEENIYVKTLYPPFSFNTIDYL